MILCHLRWADDVIQADWWDLKQSCSTLSVKCENKILYDFKFWNTAVVLFRERLVKWIFSVKTVAEPIKITISWAIIKWYKFFNNMKQGAKIPAVYENEIFVWTRWKIALLGFFRSQYNKNGVKRRNTLGCLDQCTCKVLRLWSSQDRETV